eukprot:Clim_evm46s136 gene=Clim_evmTU46s136
MNLPRAFGGLRYVTLRSSRAILAIRARGMANVTNILPEEYRDENQALKLRNRVGQLRKWPVFTPFRGSNLLKEYEVSVWKPILHSEAWLLYFDNYLNHEEYMTIKNAKEKEGHTIRRATSRIIRPYLATTNMKNMRNFFRGRIHVVYSADPEQTLDFAKAMKHVQTVAGDKLELIGGKFGDFLLDAEQVREVSKLPAVADSQGQIVGMLHHSLQQLTQINQPAQLLRQRLQQAPQQFSINLSQIEEKFKGDTGEDKGSAK